MSLRGNMFYQYEKKVVVGTACGLNEAGFLHHPYYQSTLSI